MSGLSSKKASLGFRTKELVVKISLLALGLTFESVSKLSAEAKAELEDWEEGLVFSVGVLPDGPAIAVRKEGGRLVYLGKGHHGSELRILFKNIDSALLPLTGQIGAHIAFAQHRAVVHGSLYEAMQVNRMMAIVQKFLMPGFIMNKISKRPIKMTGADYLAKGRIMLTLTPSLLMNMNK